jgi:hypothetical protein
VKADTAKNNPVTTMASSAELVELAINNENHCYVHLFGNDDYSSYNYNY